MTNHLTRLTGSILRVHASRADGPITRTTAIAERVVEAFGRGYDGRGRLDLVKSGSGALLRQVEHTYSSGTGYLETTTDGEGQQQGRSCQVASSGRQKRAGRSSIDR
jgi:hypothetical protein